MSVAVEHCTLECVILLLMMLLLTAAAIACMLTGDDEWVMWLQLYTAAHTQGGHTSCCEWTAETADTCAAVCVCVCQGEHNGGDTRVGTVITRVLRLTTTMTTITTTVTMSEVSCLCCRTAGCVLQYPHPITHSLTHCNSQRVTACCNRHKTAQRETVCGGVCVCVCVQ